MEEDVIRNWAKDGQVVPGMFFRDEAGGAWTPVEQSPFASLMNPTAAAAIQPSASEALGTLLIAVPFFGTLLIWFWVGQMNLFQDPSGSLTMVTLGTVGLTALLIATEASQIGMGRRKGSNGKEQSGPITWFIAACLLWIVAYPWYLSTRRYFGRRPLAVAGAIMAILFAGSAWMMGSAIEAKKAEVSRSLNSLGDAFR